MANRIGDQVEAQIQRIDRWRKSALPANDGVQSSGIGVGRGLVARLWRGGVLLAGMLAFLLDVFFSAIGLAIEVLDGLLGWPLLLLAGPIEVLLSVPYAGRILGGVWRLVLALFWGALNLLELPLVLLGVMPEKRLRLWVCVPHWEQDELQEERWLKALDLAAQILRREANIRLVPATAFQTNFGLDLDEDRASTDLWFRQLDWPSEGSRLALRCNVEALKEDIGPVGSRLDRWALRAHPRGSFRRVTGFGAPLMVMPAESVEAESLAGCSLGPLTDYVTVRSGNPVCLAHEIGHACNLPHSKAPNNLMNPTCGGVHLNRWQVLLLRLSRHLTFF